MLAFAVPSGLVLSFGVLSVNILRLVLLVLALPACGQYMRKLSSGRHVFVLSDLFIVLLSIWMLTALTLSEGFDRSIEGVGIMILEIAGGYLVGRTWLGSRSGFQAFRSATRILLLCLIPLAVLDPLTGRYVLADFASGLSGIPTVPDMEYRFNMLRAKGPFEHSILFGSFFAFTLPIIFYGARTTVARIAFLGISVVGVFLSLSSAPMLGLFLFICLYLYDRQLSSFRMRWALLGGAIFCLILGVFLVRDNPLGVLIRNLTLDPATGYYRALIWEWAGANVMQSPVIGIGFREWFRPEWMGNSIDALWLAHALTFGIPSSVLLGLTLLTTGVAVNEKKTSRRAWTISAQETYRGVTMSIGLMVLMGFTVHFWGTMWVFLGLLAGLRAGLTEASYLAGRAMRP